MHIVVLIKEVPDTYGDRHIVLDTGSVNRTGVRVLDEIGERAVEAALEIRDQNPNSTVTVISMGPSFAAESIRRALAIGADRAVQVVDELLAGADLTLTAQVLSEAVRREKADLVITGNSSTDGNAGVMAAMVAEHLRLPQATNLSSVRIEANSATGTREVDGGTALVSTSLPAVISITDAMADPRFPSFKGIMSAKRKPFENLCAADLGIDPRDENVARSIVLSAAARPARTAGIKIIDEGTAGIELAEFLLALKLA